MKNPKNFVLDEVELLKTVFNLASFLIDFLVIRLETFNTIL